MPRGPNGEKRPPDVIGAAVMDRHLRLADALAIFAAAEPLPWTTFYVERGRALAAGSRDETARAELDRLADQARTAGLLLALPALESAVTAQKPSQTQSLFSPSISRPADA
jgi:hypothetical protein